jgi:hypothetical protein
MALPNSNQQTIETLSEIAKLTSLANRFSYLRKASDSKLEEKVLNTVKR